MFDASGARKVPGEFLRRDAAGKPADV